ncbi:MAG: SMR family transporter [Phycisphaeraceae bacterium]
MHLLALAIGIISNAAANILIKTAMRRLSDAQLGPAFFLQAILDPILITGILCFGLALAFYAFALTKIDLSIGYPAMTSLGLIIVAAWSAVVFGEKLSIIRLAGMAAILLGVALLFWSSNGQQNLKSEETPFPSEAATDA